MKLITTTANDFVKQEVQEYGWDHVDDMFAQGYEPILANGVWAWRQINVSKPNQYIYGSCNSDSSTLHRSRHRVSLV